MHFARVGARVIVRKYVMPYKRVIEAAAILLLFVTGSFGADTKDETVQTILAAARERSTDRLQRLIDQGIDINTQNQNGQTALVVAASLGERNVVLFLLKKGALVDTAMKRYGWTALMEASFNGRSDMARLLLDNRADVNLVDSYRRTPLMLAVIGIHRNMETVELLLKRGAATNVRDDQGATAFLTAARYGMGQCDSRPSQKGRRYQ